MKILSALLTGFALVSGENADGDDSLVELVRDLGKRYYISCTTILFSGELHRRAYRIGKRMMTLQESHGYVTVKSVQTYLGLYGRQQQKECSRIFYLFLSNGDAEMREDFRRLTQSVTISGTVWLIYLTSNASIQEVFQMANVAYNMDTIVAQPLRNGSIRLSDVYRVSMKHPVRVEKYGVWSKHDGLSSLKFPISYYMRRQDLEGITLRVVLKHNPPNHDVVPNENGSGIHMQGMLGDIWSHLEEKLNFSSRFSLTNRTGALQSNHEWSGMMGMMLRHGMEAGVGEVTMSPERCAIFHCLRPLIVTRNQLYFKKTRERLQWDAILKPFHADTWTTILLWLLSSAACLNLCFRVSRSYNLERSDVNFNFCNSLETIYSALCQQGSYATPNSISCRIIFFMSYIVAAIVFTVFSASLTSFLAAQQPYRPFENLEQLLRDGTYTLQPVRDSASHVFFSTATDSFSQEIYRKLIAVVPPENLPGNQKEGLERVCRNEKIVYFGTEFETRRAVGEINFNGKCKIITLEHPLNIVYLTFLLSKESPFKDVLNYNLDILNYNGLMRRHLKKALERMKITEEEKFVGVGITQVFQMHILLFVGICASLVFFIAEKVTYSAALRRPVKSYV